MQQRNTLMVSRGLVIDSEETAKKGIAPEIADERALNRWKDRPIEQQLVELRMLREDLVSKIDFVRAEIDETLAAGFQREVDDFTAQIKRLEKIYRRRSAQTRKADKKTTVARDRLVAHLREAAEKIPEEGDSPVIELGRKARRAVAQHDRLEAETNDQAFARLTDREKVQTSYEWLNNLMMNDYAIADKMGMSREDVAAFYRKTHAFEQILDAEDRNKKIPNDDAPPAAKDAADLLLANMAPKAAKPSTSRQTIFLGKGETELTKKLRFPPAANRQQRVVNSINRPAFWPATESADSKTTIPIIIRVFMRAFLTYKDMFLRLIFRSD